MTSIAGGTTWLTEPRRSQPTSRLLLLAMLLYATSLVKFVVRDPLSTQAGPQGAIELLLVMAASLMLLPALPGLRRKPFVTQVAKAFVLFGALAAVSSIFSYDPILSFAKAICFTLVCGIAVIACDAFKPPQVLKYFYYSVISIFLTGLVLKLVSSGPLFERDEYSGRSRFTMFAWHPGTLADLSALTLLVGALLPKKPPLYLQFFLFGLNIATAARSSSALLVLVLLAMGFATARMRPRLLFVCGCLGMLAALLWWAGLRGTQEATNVAQALYGNKLNEDVTTLSGRKEVWDAAETLIVHSMVLGYGLDGARDVLIENTSWKAGNAHNALIELILTGGLPAALVFLGGWAASARRAWLCGGFTRIRVLGIYGYMVLFGITAPNLTYLQYAALFLVITLDSMAYMESHPQTGEVRLTSLRLAGGEMGI
jgi:O-Antigen ligase